MQIDHDRANIVEYLYFFRLVVSRQVPGKTSAFAELVILEMALLVRVPFLW
jgi:hypothetical protein